MLVRPLYLGAGDRSRTYDLRITNALLYQLSYTGSREMKLYGEIRDLGNRFCEIFFSLLRLLRETLDPADFPLSLHRDATRRGHIAKARLY